jgi:EKC/KEOPS complex subunit PCC1/LAGE3
MLRVSVNGFFESLNVVLQVMQELDLDVLQEKGLEDLDGAQGVEQGMIGTTVTGA